MNADAGTTITMVVHLTTNLPPGRKLQLVLPHPSHRCMLIPAIKRVTDRARTTRRFHAPDRDRLDRDWINCWDGLHYHPGRLQCLLLEGCEDGISGRTRTGRSQPKLPANRPRQPKRHSVNCDISSRCRRLSKKRLPWRLSMKWPATHEVGESSFTPIVRSTTKPA